MRVPGIGGPRRVLGAAGTALEQHGLTITATAPVIETAPIGPSSRCYANGAVLAESTLAPPDLLALLQAVERSFGRDRDQRRGARWRARALDLDIILWSGGIWDAPHLSIPHTLFRTREFVLQPASAIARHWHDPLSGLTVGQLHARLRKPRKTR